MKIQILNSDVLQIYKKVDDKKYALMFDIYLVEVDLLKKTIFIKYSEEFYHTDIFEFEKLIISNETENDIIDEFILTVNDKQFTIENYKTKYNFIE